MAIRLTQFTTSDDYEIFDAYYAGEKDRREQWETPLFTKAQAEKYLQGQDYLHLSPSNVWNKHKVPAIVWYSGEDPQGEIIPAQTMTTDKGETVEVYEIPGEFMLASEITCEYDDCGEPAQWIMENDTTHEMVPMCHDHANHTWEIDHTHTAVTDSEIIDNRPQ